ncbi:BLUF domain-containing protein [Psychrobacter jeotgali]|uniref:BLUF domain-containing protein n=1 Tax=Psychrobacter jeotgali TaxID=179010 RepID=UPI00191AFC42|nr:BLUF domain-containing protein [Psychrobacter jeotgali]
MTSPLDHIDKVKMLDKIPENALIQMVYVSSLTMTARLNTSMFDEVKVSAREYNQQHNITGVLCYGNGRFLQCIEGEKAQVLTLQQRIFADKRHKDIKILLLQAIDQRDFIDWRMRLLFLERWLWSPTTKKQVTQLSPFLPFAPHSWDSERAERFLQVIRTFDTPPHIKSAGITYNAVGNMFRHIIAPHQAFLVVQGVLALLLFIALILLYYQF